MGSIGDDLNECLKAHAILMKEAGEKDHKIEDLEEDIIKLEDDLENTERLRDKWYKLAQERKTLFEGCKTDLTNCKAKVTKLENSSFASASVKELLLEVIRRILSIEGR